MAAETLHIGFFPDFKSSNTLLFEGGSTHLGQLTEALKPLAAGECASLLLHSLPFVVAHGGVQVSAVRSSLDTGIRCLEQTKAFAWERDTIGWQDTLDKIATLIRCKNGHHYFDSENDKVTVEISNGEYGAAWWAAQN